MAILIRPGRRIKKKKSKTAEEILAKLRSYLDGNSEEPARILCGFWKDQQDAITYQELRSAVIAGELSEETYRLWSQDYSVLVKKQMSGIWEKAMSAGSISQPIMQEVSVDFIKTPSVIRWISERGAEFVTVIAQEQKDAIQALLAKKVIENHTVDELSRLIRPCIGLTEGQSKASLRYYDNIVTTLKKDHPRMKQESVERRALDAATKYAEKKHRERAMNIAQAEMAFAYNRGADEGVRQARQQNLLGEVKKRWSTSGDDGVCDICRGLEGTEIGMNKEFDFKGRLLFAGQRLLPPAHPRCACAVEYIEVSEPPASVSRDMHQPEMDETADYLIRSHTPGENIADERLVVNDAVSSVPFKVQQAINSGTVIDVGKVGASQYDYVNDILYVAKGADKEEVIHEIGHLVENKMMDRLMIDKFIDNAVATVSVFDVSSEIYEDAAGNKVEIFLLSSDKFVSEYQGRLYADSPFDAFDETGRLTKDFLMEFISEAFRTYSVDKNLLIRKYPELYEYIKEVVE